jgi:hypothetical protein
MSKLKNFPNHDLMKQDGERSLLKIEITEDLRAKIDEFIEHLLKSYYPYDALCWALAEFQLIFEKGKKNYSEHDVIERAEKLLDAFLDYDDLCRFIADLKIYLEEAGIYP